MDDVTAIFDENEIMISFSDEYFVFDDVRCPLRLRRSCWYSLRRR